jgi:hypothetical protein
VSKPHVSPWGRRKRARAVHLGDERGVAAVEFAIVSILLLTLLYGLLTYGFVFGLQHDLTHAASEGARAALRAPAGEEVERAEARARAALSFQAAEDEAVIDAELLSGADCEPDEPILQCIRVTITYDYRAHPIVPPLLNVGVPQTMRGAAVVELD